MLTVGGSVHLTCLCELGFKKACSRNFFLQGANNPTFLIYNWTQNIDPKVHVNMSLVTFQYKLCCTSKRFSRNNNTQPISSVWPFLLISFPPLLMWPTVQPAGQEQSPVIWWHVPPFWQGQRCSHWGPWLPEGQRSPQLSPHKSRVKCLCINEKNTHTFNKRHGNIFWLTPRRKSQSTKYVDGTHKAPVYPGAQMHSPVSWLQVAPLRHWQWSWHALP